MKNQRYNHTERSLLAQIAMEKLNLELNRFQVIDAECILIKHRTADAKLTGFRSVWMANMNIPKAVQHGDIFLKILWQECQPKKLRVKRETENLKSRLDKSSAVRRFFYLKAP